MNEQTWIESPAGATVKRGLAFLLGLLALALNKYAHLELSTETQAMITTLVLGFVAQSSMHSMAKVKANAQATITTLPAAVEELKKVQP